MTAPGSVRPEDGPLRVLHCHFGKEGGAERFFVNLAQAFARRGVEQRFVIRPGRSWEPDVAALGPVLRSNFRRGSPASFLLHLRAELLVRRWKPHAAMAWMPRAGRLLHPWPDVVNLARMGDFPRHLRHFRNCDVLVGNLPGIAVHCRTLGWTRPLLTISNFPSPVTPRPVSRADLGTPPDAFLVVAGGRFEPRKGLDVALRAAAALPGAWLWLVGDGRERPALERLAAELGVADRVRFTGWVRQAIHHVAAADAFVMPSRHEPLGNILLEAWHAGIPSVSTRSEGPEWYMRDGVDGLLVPIDDHAAMAHALARLRDEPGLGPDLARNASARLADWFSEEAVVQAYLRVFRGDLAQAPMAA
jgi:glycosyltransferase involved in cell wall biosynthesis